jgi:hypothetical protein
VVARKDASARNADKHVAERITTKHVTARNSSKDAFEGKAIKDVSVKSSMF